MLICSAGMATLSGGLSSSQRSAAWSSSRTSRLSGPVLTARGPNPAAHSSAACSRATDGTGSGCPSRPAPW